MSNRFDYSPARWNRLSRSIRRLDTNTVEIKVSDNSLGKFVLILGVLQGFAFIAFFLYSISGERVVPNRPSSISTMQEMLEDRYLLITDLETWLIPTRERILQRREDRINAFSDDAFYEPEPIEPYEEFYARFAKIRGETPTARFWGVIGGYNLGLYLVIFSIFIMFRLFLPASAPVRLDAQRRAVYARSWYGLAPKRFFGVGDLRSGYHNKIPETLEELNFRTDYDPECAAHWQNTRQSRLQRLVYPFTPPAMIHLRDTGFGPLQRFALGAYPQRKDQPEEIGQFIEDYFNHPDPGEWTKNLRYRWPIWGDLRGWIINANLFPCRPYNEGKTLGKLQKCFADLDKMRRIDRTSRSNDEN